MNFSAFRSLSALALALALPLGAACDTDTSEPGPDGPSDEEPGPDTEPDPQPQSCPVPTQGPTIHKAGAIEADETWTADASPHIVEGFIAVRKATLTIEPCAVVQFDGIYAGFTVAYPGSPTTGSIVAEGSENLPIRFEGLDGARWGHVLIEAGGTARFAHLTMTDGGGYDPRGASLIVYGDSTLPVNRDVFADHLTIERSLGTGVVLERLGTFTEDSDALVVTDSGSADKLPFPVTTDEHGMLGLPRGTYTGNLDDRIYIDPEQRLSVSGTMKNLGVPYKIGSFGDDDFVVGAGEENGLVTLTIEPGTEIEMHAGTAFKVEHYTGPFAASGAVVAEGNAAAPIVFRSAAEVPAAGDWQGLNFGGIARTENSFKHVRLEHTGAWCGCILTGCSAIEEYEGAIIFSQQPARAFFEDSVVAHGSGHGVVLGYVGTMVDVAGGLTFEDMDGCRQTLPAPPSPQSCPNPKPSCE